MDEAGRKAARRRAVIAFVAAGVLVVVSAVGLMWCRERAERHLGPWNTPGVEMPRNGRVPGPGVNAPRNGMRGFGNGYGNQDGVQGPQSGRRTPRPGASGNGPASGPAGGATGSSLPNGPQDGQPGGNATTTVPASGGI